MSIDLALQARHCVSFPRIPLRTEEKEGRKEGWTDKDKSRDCSILRLTFVGNLKEKEKSFFFCNSTSGVTRNRSTSTDKCARYFCKEKL